MERRACPVRGSSKLSPALHSSGSIGWSSCTRDQFNIGTGGAINVIGNLGVTMLDISYQRNTGNPPDRQCFL